jgi:hypothetical protein
MSVNTQTNTIEDSVINPPNTIEDRNIIEFMNNTSNTIRIFEQMEQITNKKHITIMMKYIAFKRIPKNLTAEINHSKERMKNIQNKYNNFKKQGSFNKYEYTEAKNDVIRYKKIIAEKQRNRRKIMRSNKNFRFIEMREKIEQNIYTIEETYEKVEASFSEEFVTHYKEDVEMNEIEKEIQVYYNKIIMTVINSPSYNEIWGKIEEMEKENGKPFRGPYNMVV